MLSLAKLNVNHSVIVQLLGFLVFDQNSFNVCYLIIFKIKLMTFLLFYNVYPILLLLFITNISLVIDFITIYTPTL